MADDMHSGVCSGNWWARSGGGSFGGTSSSTCTEAGTMSEISGFSWQSSEITESKARSEDESMDNHSTSISGGSSMVFPEVLHKQDSSGVIMDSSLQLTGFGLSSPITDWNYALMRSGVRTENSLHAMLPYEDLNSRPTFRQDPSIHSGNFPKDWVDGEDSNMSTLKQMHQHNLFGIEQRLNPSECSVTGRNIQLNNFSGYGYPSPVIQGFLDQEAQMLGVPSLNYRLNSQSLFPDEFHPSWSKFPQILKPTSSSSSSPPKQQLSNLLQFSNNGPLWNASTTMAADIRPALYASSPSQFPYPTFEEKLNLHSITKRNSENVGDTSASDGKKSSQNEPAFKRPRLDTSSPLPTFKVRKEKLGDRITALQQLVAPFGKTDTASVLHEAIQYIKFLHEQVSALSNPYMKSGSQMQQQHPQNSDKLKDHEGPKQDLRSRGLCLVPISSTFPVNNETAADFWPPTFGGNYR